ncbi:Peptidase M3A/M3B [Lasiodiplodia theobromae]|uniref:Metallopeptidase n=1 Tax=Lasiodiplodia theobromae TaxID=45133 RepID=UPI0015C3B30A|nr:Metallopeptidase [Lasiodiplodia theobromae]KAF4533951.1 Metallopeptidase [Lasiodiplodia theobromae]KAF9638239.1 Peptidase M3A/M3B [Lasiodiplodia theobromae]
MLRRSARRAWTCSQCMRLQQRRYGSSIAATAADFSPANRAAPDANHDDRVLRQIFDSPRFWKDFSGNTKHQVQPPSTGLFQNRYLTRPEGFQHFAEVTLQKCIKIVDKVLTASTVEEYRTLARDLDRLSDLLCRVIDLSDFVRSTHPDPKIQGAATQAYAIMYEYMNRLNTTTGLNDQLKKAASIPEVWNSWSEEEQVVAQILMRDFSKSAIDLPEETRHRFVDLSNEITHTGNDFVDGMAPERPYLRFDSSRLKGMDPVYAKSLTKWGKLTLPTVGMPAMMALRTVEDPDVRREVYVANRTASRANILRLEEMLQKRAELAKISGYDTYGHMALSDKMASTPEAVNQFLGALVEDNHVQVNGELQELLELKKSDARSDNFPGRLNAWDRDYYAQHLLSSLRTRIRSPDFLWSFFSLGTVIQGLSRLFTRLYGIRLVPHETLPGETWNSDVRRLDVIDENEGHIAVVYCDLFSRPGKNPNPAHFTLRCSRLISSEEIMEAAQTSHPFSSPVDAATDGMASAVNRADKTGNSYYQLPTIALICDFDTIGQGLHSSRPTLLSFREVQTLFHEMGHALHSICGRTQLQNVSGTRCATDFAELPSVLMEHFAAAPQVLALFARHYETDAPLPYRMVEERVAIDRRMAGAETEAQILLAMLDQAYHSELPLQPGFDSTQTYHDIYNAHSTIPEPAGTAWQGFFGHLFGYGATYYSYLFDRAIAGKLWKDVFQEGEKSIDREAGARYREEVLRWGGGRDGWRCVAGVLGREELAEGGAEAMKEVGKWGVHD